MDDNPDELYSEADYAEAASKAEDREYPHLDYVCELCGQSSTTVNADGVCRWCEQIAGAEQ